MFVPFDTWTGGRSIPSIGTNAGAPGIPFQNWRRFKEAFPPELVARAIGESSRPVKRCLDPFGGSGTTALACQFLGIHPTTIEVNPFLADLIEAKLAPYDATDVARSFAELVKIANRQRIDPLSRQHLVAIVQGDAKPSDKMVERLKKAIVTQDYQHRAADSESVSLFAKVREIGVRKCARLAELDPGHLARIANGTRKATTAALKKLKAALVTDQDARQSTSAVRKSPKRN